jgi:raffinose/stachyose/melibiose transport system substrate-binding protein
MTTRKSISRRDFLKASSALAAGTLLAGCAPQIITQTVRETVEVPVEKTVAVPQTQIVKETVQVATTVEVPVEVKEKKPDKLVFWHMYFDDDASKGLVIKDFAGTFGSTTGIKVELSQIAWGDHVTRMQTVGAAKDKVPDTFVSGLARPGLQGMVDGGFVMPLDDFLTPDDIAQYQPSLLEACKFNGKIYALPQEAQIFGFLYNMKVFQDLGISEPTKIDELEAYMDKMLAKGIVPLGVVGAAGTFAAEWLTHSLGAQVATQAEMDAITTGKAKFSDKFLVVEETMERWGKKGYYGNVLVNDWGPEVIAMHDGKTAMMCMGIFFAAESKAQFHEEDLKYGILVPPTLASGVPKQIGGGLWWGVSVNKYTDNPAWATRLAVEMTGKGFSEQWIRRTDNPGSGAVNTANITWTTLKRAYEILADHAVCWLNIPSKISSDFDSVQTQLVANKIAAKDAADKIDALFASL